MHRLSTTPGVGSQGPIGLGHFSEKCLVGVGTLRHPVYAIERGHAVVVCRVSIRAVELWLVVVVSGYRCASVVGENDAADAFKKSKA